MITALDRAIDELRDSLRLLLTEDSRKSHFTRTQAAENQENVPEESTEGSVLIIAYDKFGEHLEYMEDLMARNLSERYERYIYNWFLENWPDLCFLAYDEGTKKLIGAVVGKLDEETEELGAAGYIAMLAVEKEYRQRGIGKALISRFVESCQQNKAVEVYLETETINIGALRLYDSLGFIKSHLYTAYYENGNDAYYLRYFIEEPTSYEPRKPPHIDQILQESRGKSEMS